MEQSDSTVGVDYFLIFHPNIPPMLLSMLSGGIANDIVN